MLRDLSTLIMVLMWLVGLVIAKGFWSTFFAAIFPLYSWYLFAEHFLLKYNLL